MNETEADAPAGATGNTAVVYAAGVAVTIRCEGLRPDASLGRIPVGFQDVDPDCPCDLAQSLHIGHGPLDGTLPEGRDPGNTSWFFDNDGDSIAVRAWNARGRQCLVIDSPDFMEHGDCVIDDASIATICHGDFRRAWRDLFGLLSLSLLLLRHRGLAFHGAALRIGGEGVLCVGVSGRGKSTISRMAEMAGETPFCDERPIIRMQADGSFRLHGTPWYSSGNYARNISAPLRRVYFIEHGERDEVIPLKPIEVLSRIQRVAIIPWQNPAFFDPALKTVEALISAVPCATLRFRPTPDVIDAIRRDLEN